MAQRSHKLATLLFVHGLARQAVPLAIGWSALVWWRIGPLWAVLFLLLTWNYVLVWALNWVRPALVNGPWRVRPWQTLILLANLIAAPIVYYTRLGVFDGYVWTFLLLNLLLIASLVVGTAIALYFRDKLPQTVMSAGAGGKREPAA